MSELQKCPVCAGTGFRRLFPVTVLQARHSVDECRACKTAFLNPPLPSGELESFYTPGYFEEFYGEGRRTILEAAGLEVLNRVRPLLPARGRVLDVGAACGAYLAPFCAQGWEAEGVEAAGYARELALRNYRIRLHEDFFSAPFADSSFDLVLMNQFLEHVADPASYIARARRLLKPGGILYLAVPNFGSPAARKLKQDWPDLRPGEHLFFFTRESLRFLVEREGFSVVSLETLRAVLTQKDCAAALGPKSAVALSSLLGRFAPRLKRAVRSLAGRFLQGEGIELIARKDGAP